MHQHESHDDGAAGAGAAGADAGRLRRRCNAHCLVARANRERDDRHPSDAHLSAHADTSPDTGTDRYPRANAHADSDRAGDRSPDRGSTTDLEIVEFGFTGIPGDTSVAQYAVIIENPNPTGWIAARARLQISFFDADGSLLTTEKTYVEAVLLGQTTAVAGPVFEAGEAESMEVLLFQPEWNEIDFTPDRFTFSDVRTRDQQFGGVRTTGRITSEFEADQEDVQVTVVYRNGQGDVIGGETTYVSVPSMQTASFEVSPLGELDPASEEVYFQLTPRGRPRAP